MKIFYSRFMTNWLLAGILVVLAAHLWVKTEPVANAETLLLDNCVTLATDETPRGYVHVVTHAARDAR